MKHVLEQSAILFDTILYSPKLKNLRFATTTILNLSSADLSSLDSTLFQNDDDDNNNNNNNNEKEIYLTRLAVDLYQDCFQFCIEHPTHSAFEQCLDILIRFVNSSISNNIEIIKKLTNESNGTNTIPEIFYLNYTKPLMKIAIERRCSLDHIVELTIQVLHSFDSTEDVVERILADLIQVRMKELVSFFFQIIRLSGKFVQLTYC